MNIVDPYSASNQLQPNVMASLVRTATAFDALIKALKVEVPVAVQLLQKNVDIVQNRNWLNSLIKSNTDAQIEQNEVDLKKQSNKCVDPSVLVK